MGDENPYVSALAVAPSGKSIYLTGYSGAADFATFAMDASGKQR